jgi:hypothetical protein
MDDARVDRALIHPVLDDPDSNELAMEAVRKCTDITRMPCSWRQCMTVFTEDLPWLKGRDIELVIGEAVCN